uniref:Uncharacterized protein n=1 Tax=Ditylum brightwellii TaxID=49249 RepID=A0A7S4QZG0_9STRA
MQELAAPLDQPYGDHIHRRRKSSVKKGGSVNLTPAAQSLLAKTTQKTPSSLFSTPNSNKMNARAGSAFGSALRGSYTPQLHSSKRKSSQKRSNREVALIASTPKHGVTSNRKISGATNGKSSGGNLTDGLLQL